MNIHIAVFIHWISMFLALTGGVMMAVWLFKNLKAKQLFSVIIVIIVVGLLGSFLTFLGLQSQLVGMMQ